MAKLEHPAIAKRFESPDQRQTYEHGEIDLLTLDGMTLGYGILEPGWSWSSDVKPLVGTESCQGHHIGYVIAGKMHVEMKDGTSLEIEAGQAFDVPPGHDACVIGNEQVIQLQVTGAESLVKH